jgi:hypothetical protein
MPTDDNGAKAWNLVSTLLRQISAVLSCCFTSLLESALFLIFSSSRLSSLFHNHHQGTGYLAVDGEYVLDVAELINSNAMRAELDILREDNKNLQQSTQEQIKKLKDDNRALRDQVAELKAKVSGEHTHTHAHTHTHTHTHPHTHTLRCTLITQVGCDQETAPRSGPTPEDVKRLEQQISDLKEELEEANYNVERAGARVSDLAAVISTMEDKERSEKLAHTKEIETLTEAHESEMSQVCLVVTFGLALRVTRRTLRQSHLLCSELTAVSGLEPAHGRGGAEGGGDRVAAAYSAGHGIQAGRNATQDRRPGVSAEAGAG